MKDTTNQNIWVVVTSQHREVPFLAGDMVEVRKKALSLGGARYRNVYQVPPTHRHHRIFALRLGLDPGASG